MRSFEHEGQGRRSGNLVPEPTGEGSEGCSSSTQHATPGMRLYPWQPAFPGAKCKNQRQQKRLKSKFPKPERVTHPPSWHPMRQRPRSKGVGQPADESTLCRSGQSPAFPHNKVPRKPHNECFSQQGSKDSGWLAVYCLPATWGFTLWKDVRKRLCDLLVLLQVATQCVSSTAPLRIPDFWFEDEIVP